MNGRRLTDRQISQALRAHLPDRAGPGLRDRIFEAAKTTRQQRALPSVIGALGEAGPGVRRRGLLVAAALLVAVALASVAAVGALRLLQRDPIQDLSVVPPTDATTPSASPSANLRAVVAPSSTPSATESTTAGPGGVWIATGPMGTPHGTAAVRLLDGRVLVAGDVDQGTGQTSAELYDPDSGTWSATGAMIHTPASLPATLLRDGTVLVGDIRNDNPDNPSYGAELYDPGTGTWSSTGNPLPLGWGDTATLLNDGRVLVTGYNDCCIQKGQTVEAQVYDPDSGTWTPTGNMITRRYNHTATLLSDGRVFVAGGDVNDVATDSAELYDPETGSWTATTKMRATGNKRYDLIRATLLQDGTVLVVRPTSAALYDPATGTWTATGDMARPGTFYPTATRLLDGTVLVAGGSNGEHDTAATAEVYDPVTRSWTKIGSMHYGRGSATLLLDGTVLIAGGNGGSSERYIPAGVSPPIGLAPVPSPTPSPTPTPIPTPFPPAAGPVPAGARTWKVTVVNKSSKPATLLVAEEDQNGPARLVGSVTPNVVPAGATIQVTFLVPPKGVGDGWIWVNPVPGQGGSFFATDDVPTKGEFRIDAGGQVGWLSQ
jgi:hypothetical protein